MTQREFQEREMSFDEAIALLKQHESITNLIEAVKRKITRLELMMISYRASAKAFKAKEKPLNQIEITQLTTAREHFKNQILGYIPEVEKEVDNICSRFTEKGIEIKYIDWSHHEPQTNIYLRLKEWFERLKDFDKTSQTTTIKM